jgi:3-phytase
VLAAVVAMAVSGSGVGYASVGSKPPSLQFLGQAIVPTGTTFAGTTIGGLSSITYDSARGVFYSLSDDQSQFNPARFYTLRVDLGDGHLDDGDVKFTGVTTLLAPGGQPYAPFSLDPEGLTLTKSGELVVTSEGISNSGIPPWVRRYALDGRFLGDLPVPDAFMPTSPTHGVRQNLAFEAAAVAPDGRHLFVGMEGALAQDGPAASLSGGSASRILRYNLATGRLERQFVYFTDPIAEPPVPPTQFAVSGLVELLPFNDEFMLSMERSFSVGAPGTGNTIKLYSVAFPERTT